VGLRDVKFVHCDGTLTIPLFSRWKLKGGIKQKIYTVHIRPVMTCEFFSMSLSKLFGMLSVVLFLHE
jgi:hypothetical protein